MSTRNAARNVRQRKLNTKQPLRIVRESELDEQLEEEPQRIPHVETGVEKGEEIEYHLQAVINAAAQESTGAKPNTSYIPTPEASKARGVQYDKLYPKTFSVPATYVRFSSTVEDSIGTPYCMNDDDVAMLAKLNDGKDVNGRERKDKLSQCSEDTFEEVLSFFEDVSQRIQPFANIDNAPLMSLQEMEQSVEDDTLSANAAKWLKTIYQYWAMQKGSRPLLPSIKVRVLDTTSEADDADPYVCFRRREVRQTRKTRGRDAQVVEKLKKLRLELEQARQLVQMAVQRESLNKDQLEISRRVFEQRGQLKRVKIEKNIVGEKGEDEELLINQKPIPKPKPRQSIDQRPGPTIRLRASSDRQMPDNDLVMLEDQKAEAQATVEQQIQNRKIQHRRWNEHWQDQTWAPITPPLEPVDKPSGWGFLQTFSSGYPTPPPTIPSEGSQKEDVDMADAPAPISPPKEMDMAPGASPEPEVIVMSMPGAYPVSPHERDANPACRLRRGRGGRLYLEARKRRRPRIFSGVVTDSDDSEDDAAPDYHPVNDRILFDYRCALNRRPDAVSADRKPSAGVEGGAPQLQQ